MIETNEYKLYKGKVINTDDPEQKGRIQVRVIPELENTTLTKDNDMPWFEPFFGNCSETEMEKKELLVDSIVWIIIDTYWKKFFYLGYYNRNYFFDFGKILKILKSVADIKNKEYNNLRFSLLPDNSLFFHNTSNSESGAIYNTGSFILHKSDGSFLINSKDKLNILTTNNMEVESSGNIVLKGMDVNITGGNMTVNGTVEPSDNGPFCAIPNCLFTGSPHIGNKVSNT